MLSTTSKSWRRIWQLEDYPSHQQLKRAVKTAENCQSMPGCFAMFLQILTTIGRQANSKIIMINVKTMYCLKERILFWSQDNIPVEMRKKLSDVVGLTQWAIWLALKPHTPKFAPTTTTHSTIHITWIPNIQIYTQPYTKLVFHADVSNYQKSSHRNMHRRYFKKYLSYSSRSLL